MPTTPEAGFATPGANHGLLSVFSYRYLLALLVKKEVSVRYRGSVLGWLWSFAKPLAQFLVLWVALGIIVRVGGEIELYPVYLFAGMILVNFFIEAFSNGTRSLVDNAELIKKIYLPRELFPIASTIVAIVNFLPQVLVLLVVTMFIGWQPMWQTPVAFLLATIIIAVLATGLAMLFGAINVSFRDAQNFVDLITMTALWASPVLYSMSLVEGPAPDWLLVLYQLNPVTPAVELMHLAFWAPVTSDPASHDSMLSIFTLIAFLSSLLVLFIGQLVFRRLEGRFAQDL